MTINEAFKEYENLPTEEKKHYSSFDDYVGGQGLSVCESCDELCEYDEVDECGLCCNCSDN
jgi:hypothetical protein